MFPPSLPLRPTPNVLAMLYWLCICIFGTYLWYFRRKKFVLNQLISKRMNHSRDIKSKVDRHTTPLYASQGPPLWPRRSSHREYVI